MIDCMSQFCYSATVRVLDNLILIPFNLKESQNRSQDSFQHIPYLKPTADARIQSGYLKISVEPLNTDIQGRVTVPHFTIIVLVLEAIDDPNHIKFTPQLCASHSSLSQPRSVSLQLRQKFICKLDRRAPQSEILLFVPSSRAVYMM